MHLLIEAKQASQEQDICFIGLGFFFQIENAVVFSKSIAVKVTV